MASKLVIFAVTLFIYKVQSQTVSCYLQPSSSSNPSSGCESSQPQTFQIIPSNSNGRIKASPQLQIMPGQGSLKAIPISNLVAPQGANSQKLPVGGSIAQNIPVPLAPQVPPAQCPPAQPPYNPIVITSPVSTIAIPPSCSTTMIDNSLSNSLANALLLLIASDFLNCAASKNIINQDCISLPAVETCIPGFDLSSLVRNLNANQLGQDASCQPGTSGQTCQSGPTGYNGQICQSVSTATCNEPDESYPTGYDWENLLERLRDQCGQNQYTTDSDWAIVLDYINSQIDRSDCGSYDKNCNRPCFIEAESENCNYDYNSFINYLRQKGQTGAQIAGQYQTQNCDTVQNYQQPAYVSQSCDTDNAILDALAVYLGGSNVVSYPSSVPNEAVPNVAEVIFPEEIPAQLICNFGYIPTTVPAVTFSVQPLNPSCNYAVGNQCQI